MRSADILIDAYGRVREEVHSVVDGLTPEQLAHRIDERANSIAWLVWHLTRILDDHLAEAAGTEQTWIAGNWSERFGLPFAPTATGYGHSSDDVPAVRVDSGDLLTGYHDAAYEMATSYVNRLSDPDLDRIIDERWDPPVSLGVRLVSVANDMAQHVGQAAFARGVVLRVGSR